MGHSRKEPRCHLPSSDRYSRSQLKAARLSLARYQKSSNYLCTKTGRGETLSSQTLFSSDPYGNYLIPAKLCLQGVLTCISVRGYLQNRSPKVE